MLRLWILVLTSVALQSLTAGGAQADCLAPSPLLLWSYPEDGASDVPIDAELWAFTNLGNLKPSGATLNGQDLALTEPDAQDHGLRFSPGPLSSDTSYKFVITYAARGSVPVSVFEVQFKTGAAKAKPAAPAKVVAHAESPAADAALSGCKELFVAQGCSDTIGKSAPSLHTFELASPGAVAWLVRSTHPDGRLVWPKTCGHPQLLVHEPTDKDCFTVQPIVAGGKVARAVQYCSKPGARSRPLSAAAVSPLSVRRPLEPEKAAAPATPPAEPVPPSPATTEPEAQAPAAPAETPKAACACTVAGARGPTPWVQLTCFASIVLYRRRRRLALWR
jgi:hypothetical protein